MRLGNSKSRAKWVVGLHCEKCPEHKDIIFIYTRNMLRTYYKKRYPRYSAAINPEMKYGKLYVGHLQEVGQTLVGESR